MGMLDKASEDFAKVLSLMRNAVFVLWDLEKWLDQRHIQGDGLTRQDPERDCNDRKLEFIIKFDNSKI